MTRHFSPLVVASAFVLLLAAASAARSADERIDSRAYREAVQRAVDFLRTKGQEPDGSFSSEAGPGVTALVTTALLRNGLTVNDPMVEKALEYLESHVRPDGGVHAEGSFFRNYETCLAMTCLIEANREGRYDKVIKNAERFVKDLQWDESEDHDEASYNYGGAGYGQHKRPDLSNTSFLIDALRAAGRGPDDEAIQKALVFVSRCQNIESPHNTTKFGAKNPDGGFYYTPAAGGQSQAGETPDGGLRSYGSMTYAGLKSMIYAGVDRNDPRVQAALKWIQKHYTLETNPGMGNQGLYYYYHTFAKALAAAGLDRIDDADGKSHDWRAELIAELVRRQQPDGSWINEHSRWMERNPSLVTAYALLALSYCRPSEKQ
ncbi:MAG: terpene cyclase/mutase family protein [Pirellulaceae bacterium]|nr:terpene cyclase/mutase family protein [Pirellulaceae bacterium]